MEIWTDGSCHPNPGPGGWGYVTDEGVEAFGGELRTTNNRMEMTAILAALQATPAGGSVTIYSDSMYCVNGLTKWNKSWAKSSWMRKGEAIPNRDLWMELEAAKARVRATFSWVRGHAGNPGNIAADALANRGRMSLFKGDEHEVECAPPVVTVKRRRKAVNEVSPADEAGSPDCGCGHDDCEHAEAEADRLFRAAMSLGHSAFGATYLP